MEKTPTIEEVYDAAQKHDEKGCKNCAISSECVKYGFDTCEKTFLALPAGSTEAANYYKANAEAIARAANA